MVTASPALAFDPAPGSVEATNPAGTALSWEPPTRGRKPACARVTKASPIDLPATSGTAVPFDAVLPLPPSIEPGGPSQSPVSVPWTEVRMIPAQMGAAIV